MPKDFLSVADWSADELLGMLARAEELRRLHRAGERPQTLQGRTLAMYFEKPSLRTHVTFEAGMAQLGGHAVLLRPDQVGIGTRESPLNTSTLHTESPRAGPSCKLTPGEGVKTNDTTYATWRGVFYQLMK